MSRTDDLRKLLTDYATSDAEEADHLSRMRALCDVAGDPCARDHYVPGHFTASAFIVSPDAGALLLILHGKLRRWLQPGGHVDPSDPTILAAAEREVHEEVGLSRLVPWVSGPFDLDIHDIAPRKNVPGHVHFDVRYAFHACDLAFTAASDAQAARWVKWSELNEDVSDRSVMRAVAKLRSR